MSSTDPRILIPLIEEIREELRRAVSEHQQVVQEATTAQRCLSEHAYRMATRISHLQAQTESDGHVVESALDKVENSDARTDDLKSKCEHASKDCVAIHGVCCRTRDHWQAEVARAQGRVHRAEVWVSNAEANVTRAESNVRQAEVDLLQKRNQRAEAEAEVNNCHYRVRNAQAYLETAQSDLARCQQPVVRTDSNGRRYEEHRDCSGCVAAVSRAAAALNQARHDLQRAEYQLGQATHEETLAEHRLARAQSELASARADLAKARSELQAAETDLGNCQVALQKALKAVDVAIQALKQVDLAKTTSVKAEDAVSLARVPAERSKERNDAQSNLCDQLSVLLRTAQVSIDESMFELNKVVHNLEHAFESAMNGCNAMSLRLDDLHNIDRPGVFG